MRAGPGEQKCACNLQQEESEADGYKRRARNTSGSRRDGSPEQRGHADYRARASPAVRPCGSLLSVKGSLYGFTTEISHNCPV